MKLILCFITAAFIFISGCTHKIKDNQPPPDDLIPKEQMVDIFIDLKLMDAILASKQRKRDEDIHEYKYFLHNSVMEKYGLTRDRFERSVAYYQRDLKVLDKIYEDAITQLSKMKSEEQNNN